MGLRFNKNRIIKNLRSHYDGLVDKYVEAFFEDNTDVPWINSLLNEVPKGSKVLDVGCGPGNFTSYMVQKGYKVTGIDISSKMIDKARSLVPTASFKKMNMLSMKFAANSFMGILAAYSFLHVPKAKAQQALKEFYRVLMPQGFLALLIKMGHGEHILPSPLIKDEFCYVQLWQEKEINNLLRRCGFDMVKKEFAAPISSKEIKFPKALFLTRSTKRLGILKI